MSYAWICIDTYMLVLDLLMTSRTRVMTSTENSVTYVSATQAHEIEKHSELKSRKHITTIGAELCLRESISEIETTILLCSSNARYNN